MIKLDLWTPTTKKKKENIGQFPEPVTQQGETSSLNHGWLSSYF